jgi:hypothetical protein
MMPKIPEHTVNRYIHFATRRLIWRCKLSDQRSHQRQHFTWILVLALLLIYPLLKATATQAQWQRITDREAAFSINFTGTPDYHQLANPLTKDSIEH